MAYYPILIDLEKAPCLVAGGGSIAFHKAKLLKEQGAEVTVVSTGICEELEKLGVSIERRKVSAADAEGKMLVVDATGSREAEEILSAACREMGTAYNCAGRGESCTAIFPAVLRKGRTTVAVSSLGASPAASAWLRDRLADSVPDDMDSILGRMAELRAYAKESMERQSARSAFLHACLDRMLTTGKLLEEKEVEEIRESIGGEK